MRPISCDRGNQLQAESVGEGSNTSKMEAMFAPSAFIDNRTPFGSPALPEVTRKIEANVAKILSRKLSANGTTQRAALRSTADPRPAYLKAIRKKVDLKAIGEAKMKIAYDPLFGTGRGYLNDLLREVGTRVITLHDSRDVLFSGVGPDPSEKNLAELAQTVKDEGCANVF